MIIRIQDQTINRKIEFNVLSNEIKDALNLVCDLVYIYKMDQDKLKIEVIK